MGWTEYEPVEVVLDRFVEGLFRLMQDHHRAQVVKMDLTVVQAQALKLVRATPLPSTRLAEALGISAPAVTQLMDRLGRKKLIERQAVETDRRAVMVAVTEKGVRLIDGFRQRRVEVFADALSRLSDEDRKEVIAALSKVAAVLHLPEQLRRPEAGEVAGLEDNRGEIRAPDEAAQASKRVGQKPVSLPTRRMRIEWD